MTAQLQIICVYIDVVAVRIYVAVITAPVPTICYTEHFSTASPNTPTVRVISTDYQQLLI